MIRKFMDNYLYIFMFFFIITPIIVLFFNLFGLSPFLAWYLPNLIMFGIGLKFILINLKNKKKELLILGLFLVVSFLACLFSRNVFVAFFGSDYRLEGYITYISYIGFFSCGLKLADIKKDKRIINVFFGVALIISILCIFKFDFIFKLFDIDRESYYFYTGPFFQFNHFGYYLLIVNICSLFMFLYTGKVISKILYFFINLIFLYTMVINDTFGVFLAYLFVLLLVVIFLIFKKQKLKNVVLLVLSFVFICLVTYRDNYNIVYRNFKGLLYDTSTVVNSDSKEDIYSIGTDRGKLWVYGLKFVSKKPVLGYGFDNVSYEYHDSGISESKPHNLILDLSLNSGIVGMLLYVLLIYLIISKKVRNIFSLKPIYVISLFVVVGYLVSSMFGNSTFYVSPYFYVFLGVLAQRDYGGDNDEA